FRSRPSRRPRPCSARSGGAPGTARTCRGATSAAPSRGRRGSPPGAGCGTGFVRARSRPARGRSAPTRCRPRRAGAARRPQQRRARQGRRGRSAGGGGRRGAALLGAASGARRRRCPRRLPRGPGIVARKVPRVVLSDATIARYLGEGRIEIDPYDDSLLQPSSVDVRVDAFFRVFHNNRYPFIDVKQAQEDLTELVEVDGESPFVLHPGEFVLGSTLERVRLPDDIVARLEGKSSLGRLGLL